MLTFSPSSVLPQTNAFPLPRQAAQREGVELNTTELLPSLARQVGAFNTCCDSSIKVKDTAASTLLVMMNALGKKLEALGSPLLVVEAAVQRLVPQEEETIEGGKEGARHLVAGLVPNEQTPFQIQIALTPTGPWPPLKHPRETIAFTFDSNAKQYSNSTVHNLCAMIKDCWAVPKPEEHKVVPLNRRTRKDASGQTSKTARKPVPKTKPENNNPANKPKLRTEKQEPKPEREDS